MGYMRGLRTHQQRPVKSNHLLSMSYHQCPERTLQPQGLPHKPRPSSYGHRNTRTSNTHSPNSPQSTLGLKGDSNMGSPGANCCALGFASKPVCVRGEHEIGGSARGRRVTLQVAKFGWGGRQVIVQARGWGRGVTVARFPCGSPRQGAGWPDLCDTMGSKWSGNL